MFCFYKLDALLEQDDHLMSICRWQWVHVETPLRNRLIKELSDKVAHQLTHFNKEQLQLLLIHWRTPAVIITQQQH
jgi:hypothetical protein